MKKLHGRLKKRNKIHARLCNKRRLRNKQVETFTEYKALSYSSIEAPQTLDLFGNYEESITFLNTIRKRVIGAKKPTKIDFANCSYVSPDAALVLTAEVDRCGAYRKGFIDGNFPKSEEAFLTLRDFGFYKRSNIRLPQYQQRLVPDAEIIPIISGVKPKPGDGKGNILEGLTPQFFARSGENDISTVEPIYDALHEALNNVGAHAYSVEVDDFLKTSRKSKKWWRAAIRDEKNGRIYILFYDQGVGIPNTLPAKWGDKWRQITELFGGKSPPDSIAIREATELKKTRTGNAWRGNGLHDIKQSIYSGQEGWLRIISNRGAYDIHSNGSEEANDTKESLYGTLIVWYLQLRPINTEKIKQELKAA